MAEKIGRNDPCICGSGKKYKQCCLKLKKKKKSLAGRMSLGSGVAPKSLAGLAKKRPIKATVLSAKKPETEQVEEVQVEEQGPDLIARTHSDAQTNTEDDPYTPAESAEKAESAVNERTDDKKA